MNYQYSYNQAGRVTAQHMDYYGGTQTFDAGVHVGYRRADDGDQLRPLVQPSV